ncbi:hypothetical protein [Winogradskyella schleiferi]|uniref:hypothetical protein n=1 Tax=Winogradskyella schleiferi TaxID=2686078 RepID=UPI0015C03526|nr:hypothetical protein [Winogradskyella schleiferi]
MKTTILMLCLLIAFNSIAQSDNHTDSLNLKTVDDLAFMKGTWKGDGWIMMNRERKEFTQTETIDSRVDNTILVIDGIGIAKDSSAVEPKVVHNAFGVISYNETLKSITMLSFSSTGGKMENEMRLIGDMKLEWSFKDERGGTVRFREDFSENGLWIEKGDYSFDGNQWFPFFEMRLERQDDKW